MKWNYIELIIHNILETKIVLDHDIPFFSTWNKAFFRKFDIIQSMGLLKIEKNACVEIFQTILCILLNIDAYKLKQLSMIIDAMHWLEKNPFVLRTWGLGFIHKWRHHFWKGGLGDSTWAHYTGSWLGLSLGHLSQNDKFA